MHIHMNDTTQMVEEFKRIASDIDPEIAWVQQCFPISGDGIMLAALVCESVQAGRNISLG